MPASAAVNRDARCGGVSSISAFSTQNLLLKSTSLHTHAKNVVTFLFLFGAIETLNSIGMHLIGFGVFSELESRLCLL